jgi:hypothetical protein
MAIAYPEYKDHVNCTHFMTPHDAFKYTVTNFLPIDVPSKQFSGTTIAPAPFEPPPRFTPYYYKAPPNRSVTAQQKYLIDLSIRIYLADQSLSDFQGPVNS